MTRDDPYKVDRNRWQYTVVGNGRFPIDMLRYDGCFPAGSESVGRIEHSHAADAVRTTRSVHLISTIHTPTVERWKSFGWNVLAYRGGEA